MSEINQKIKDIIFNLPYSETDRTKISKINEVEIGKVHSLRLMVKKLSFPRIRNLPNRINCEDHTGKIDIVYFNSREGYLRKIYPLNKWIIVSGKVSYFKNKQISGKAGELTYVPIHTSKPAQHVLVLGLGKRNTSLDIDVLRQHSGDVVRLLRDKHIKQASFLLNDALLYCWKESQRSC